MFMGITAHHNAKRVFSYETARACLEKCSRTPTGKARKPGPDGSFPLGLTKRRQTRVIPNSDGSIAFRLYDTDVVTWQEDGSVIVDNFGTVTTSGFASRFLPACFHLRYPVERRGGCGGGKGIIYQDAAGERRICFGRCGNMVTFRPDGDGWQPDEDDCANIIFPVLDRAESRGLNQRLNLKEFELWLAVAPFHLELEHNRFDADRCAKALERKDYATAASYLPLVKDTNSWGGHNLKPLPISTGWNAGHVTMGSIGKLKLALWEEHAMLKDDIHTTVSCDEFDRGMARVRELEALGYSGYGPRV